MTWLATAGKCIQDSARDCRQGGRRGRQDHRQRRDGGLSEAGPRGGGSAWDAGGDTSAECPCLAI